MSKKRSQNKIILDYLKTGATLSPLEAYALCGTIRLGARIFDLRENHNIKTIQRSPYGIYKLEGI